MRFLTIVLLAASLQAQPLVFGAAQRIRSDPYGSVSIPSTTSLASNGDGFLLLMDNMLVKLDEAGRTLRRVPITGYIQHVLLPFGRDYLLTTYYGQWFVVDGETMTVRPIDLKFASDVSMATNGSRTVVLEAHARVTLLDRDGTMVGPPKVLLVPAPEGAGGVASNGAGYVVAWNDGGTVKTVAVDGDGFVGREITDIYFADVPTTTPSRPLVAFGGGNYLVAWRDGRNVIARLVKPNGAPAADAILLDANFAQPTSLVWNGREFLVSYDKYVAHIDAGGKLAAPPQQFAVASMAASARGVIALRWGACSCNSCAELRAGPLDEPGELVAGAEGYASTESGVVAATEQAAIVAYEERSNRSRVRIEFVPSRGVPLDVPSTSATQTVPAVATDGTYFLVAWIETDDDCRSHVVGAIMDAAGRFGPATPISDGDVSSFAPPVMAWNGKEYAVLWRHGFQLTGRRVSSFGRPLDTGVPLVDSGLDPSIAWTGNGYLLGWIDKNDYHVRRLGADLKPVSDAVDLGPAFSGSVAWNGVDAMAFTRPTSQFRMIRIDAAGKPETLHVVALRQPSSGNPWVVWRNGEWLVTEVAGGGRVARVTRDGTLIEEVDLFKPSVALVAVSIAATPSRVIAIVETQTNPRTISVRTTDPAQPRPHASR